MEVYIPSFRYEESDLERAYTLSHLSHQHQQSGGPTAFGAFFKDLKIRLLWGHVGLQMQVFKIEVLMNGRKHFVEKRYSEFHALHKKAVILENEELPKLFLDFLNIRHLPSLPKAESCGSFEETESEESSKLSHQPVLLFLRDPYVLPAASDFPNVVIEGVLHGIFYPHLQPR
ncbi:sorting nexin-24 isoform X4 [Myotis daubentonii]|uniref:sorting nexin-24 isoform X4 n=1 Tax=Myotis daubentonii TaxID=98922 RepID=UPI0028737481|nr:sorting nexin-24 isoform X4 [Myotis daubentonii]